MIRLGCRQSFIAAAFALAVTMLGTTLPTPLYALYSDRFGFSELIVTVIFATYAVGVIGSLLLFGGASDAIGRRRALLPALVASGLSAGAFLLANGPAPILVGRVLSGLSAGVFTGTATATLIDLARPDRRARATLIATLANMGGLGLGPLLSGCVSQAFGLPLHLVFWVDLALVACAVLLVWAMREPVDTSAAARFSPQGFSVPAEARNTFVRAAIAGFAGFAVLGLFTAVVPAFIADLGITNRALVGLIVFAVFASSAIGQFAVERMSVERALPAGCGVLIAGMGVLAVGLATANVAPVVIGGVVAGVGQGLGFRSGLAALNAQTTKERRAQTASSFFTVAYVGISLPVIGVGVLAEATSLKTAGLVFAAAVAIVCALALSLLAWSSPTADS